MTRYRDSKGRYCRKPTPLLLDPALVRTLGEGRKAVALTVDTYTAVEIIQSWHYPIESPNDE